MGIKVIIAALSFPTTLSSEMGMILMRLCVKFAIQSSLIIMELSIIQNIKSSNGISSIILERKTLFIYKNR